MKAHPYVHVARATDLTGADRVLYRFLEMVPGILSLGTLILLTVLSFIAPVVVAYFTIAFSAYWLFKTAFLSIHLRHNFKRLTHNMRTDWLARLENLKYDDIVHVVLLPFYQEPYALVRESVRAIAEARYPTKRIVVVVSAEERAGEAAREVGERIREEYEHTFFTILTTVHPVGTPGEIVGKGANGVHAAKEAVKRVIDPEGIPHDRVLVSSFDVDTVVYPDYFSALTWHFLTSEDPLHASYQPVPLYNNNIWSAPALSRILAYSSTFWQMIQQERPERLATFSSHAIPLVALEDIGFWQTNVVSEDSRAYWNLFVHYGGNYRVVPLSYPVSMDANVAPTLLQTAINLYRQHRRWSYGAENIPYLIFNFIKNSHVPLHKKMQILFIQLEGFWSLVVQPLVLFAVGWLPLVVGGPVFNASILSYNLPIVSSWFLTLAMLGLVALAVYAVRLMPKPLTPQAPGTSIFLFVQWLFVPITMVLFSSIPGLEAQIRLLLGKYLGFWVTPKTRGVPETSVVHSSRTSSTI